MERLAQRQEDYFYNTGSPVLSKLFEKVAMRTEMKPFTYEGLKKTNEYISILKISGAYREDQIVWYEDWKEDLGILENTINKELEKQR